SDSPTIAAKFIDILFEAGVPKEAVNFITGPGGAVGDTLVQHPKTRYIGFTGSKEVGLRISELAGKAMPGQIWIMRTVLERGGKDGIVVDEEADIDAAVEGTAQAAFGYQGQKCSACSRVIVSEKVYDAFLQKLVDRTKKITVGPSDDPNNYMGPVINQPAMKSILDYIKLERRKGGCSPAESARRATATSLSRPSLPMFLRKRGWPRKKCLARCSRLSKQRITMKRWKSPTIPSLA